jgi:hypothetical protein
MSPRPPLQTPLPVWARVCDAVVLALLLLAATAAVTGGFRVDVPFGRLSVTTWLRPLGLAVLLVALRHGVVRRPNLAERLWHAARAVRRSPEGRAVWPVLVTTRVGVLVVGLLAIGAIGYPNGRTPWRVSETELGNLPARFDAGWYLQIAARGYEFTPNRYDRQQNLVFFPAYPLLMRYASLLVARQTLWAGVFISWGAFAWALVYLFRLARELMDEERAAAATLFMATYPFAVFFSAPYTEGLFLLAMLGAWFHFRRDEWLPASLWGLLAGLTRPNGCLLAVPLAVMAVLPLVRGGRLQRPVGGWAPVVTRVLVAGMPGFGMLLYSAWVYGFTGHPFEWVKLQQAWGRSNVGLVDFLAGEVDSVADQGAYTYVSSNVPDFLNICGVTLVAASLWGVFRRFGLAPALVLVLNLAPSLASGGWLSTGRATAVLFPTFLWLAAVVPAAHRGAWAAAFAGLQAFAAVLFFTWRPLF